MENGCMTVVCEHIRTNLTAGIEVAELAGLVKLSPHYFSLVFRQAVGVSPHQYILQERISEARLVACTVPTWAEASWLLRITMTCWLTLRESWLASASVIGLAPADAVGTPVTAPASDA